MRERNGYVGVYNITMTSRITCVYHEQWYVIITFDVTWTHSPGHAIYDFRGACAVKGNGAVAGHVKRVDHGDVFDALLFREETLTRHYFILKFDFSWGIRTDMGKTEGIFINLQCNCHIVGSILIKLINHRTISVHGCPI